MFISYAYVYLLAGLTTLVTAWMNWNRRTERGLRSLASAVGFVSLWCFAGSIELVTIPLNRKILWVTVEYLATDLFANFTFLFVLQYYGHGHWLTPARRRLFWLLPIVDIALVATNSLHHLIWTGFTWGAPGSNLLYFEHGPLYYISIAYQTLLILSAVVVLSYEIIRTRGRNRGQAIQMTISLSSPLLASFVYFLLPSHPVGISMLPLGFTISALLVSGNAFQELLYQVNQRTFALNRAVQTLQEEVSARQELELELRRSQSLLASRLADQSHKLSGVYNLILMAGRIDDSRRLLQHAMAHIMPVLKCEMICFLRTREESSLYLTACAGDHCEAAASWQALPAGWLDPDDDVHVEINLANSNELPEAFALAGFGACMFKYVPLNDEKPGVLGVFWQAPCDFSVEDIALFSAMADGLGVILENARLREMQAETAIAQERHRLARDLHDSLTQSLHSLALSAETAYHLGATQPQRLNKILAHIVDSAKQAVKEMRLLLHELRLQKNIDFDFLTALEARLDAVERRAGVSVDVTVADGLSLPEIWEKELYLIAAEALDNALKHAHATALSVNVQGRATEIELEITDNGCGFDVLEATLRSDSTGLQTMSEHAAQLGGTLEIDSTIGAGTCIRFCSGDMP